MFAPYNLTALSEHVPAMGMCTHVDPPPCALGELEVLLPVALPGRPAPPLLRLRLTFPPRNGRPTRSLSLFAREGAAGCDRQKEGFRPLGGSSTAGTCISSSSSSSSNTRFCSRVEHRGPGKQQHQPQLHREQRNQQQQQQHKQHGGQPP